MKPFAYQRAGTAAEVGEHAAAGARIIAGGTNLLDLMKHQVETPDRLIDINRLDMHAIAADGSGMRIGALVSNSDLAADPRIRSDYPVLSRALLAGASGQLRNKATTGGNLLQRTRCPYFYDTAMPCNKRTPGAGCHAIHGYNRSHAVLGTSDHCIASHPSDMSVGLRALDAQVEITAADGSLRRIGLDQLYRLPGDQPDQDTTLSPGDLITAVLLPAPVSDATHIYRKLRDRASYAFALVSVAAVVRVDDGRIAHAALAFGGIGVRPWRDAGAEAVLLGQPPSSQLFDAAADVLLATAKGHHHNAFKIALTRRMLAAVLHEATGKALIQ